MTFWQIRNAMVLAGLAVVCISAPAWAVPTVPVVPAAGGLLGLAIVGVVGGVWLARRKR